MKEKMKKFGAWLLAAALALAGAGAAQAETIKVADQAALEAELVKVNVGGSAEFELAAGEFTTYGTSIAQGKKLTLIGALGDNGELLTKWKYGADKHLDGEYGSDYSFGNTDVTFRNLELVDNYTDTSYYRGFVRATPSLRFENCTIRNMMGYLGSGDVVFKDCTFDVADVCEYCIKTYSGSSFVFDGCTFKSNNKGFVQVYCEKVDAVRKVTVKNCTFIAGAGTSKSAIYFYDYSYGQGATWDIDFVGKNVITEGHKLWGDMKIGTGAKTSISINGVAVWENGANVVTVEDVEPVVASAAEFDVAPADGETEIGAGDVAAVEAVMANTAVGKVETGIDVATAGVSADKKYVSVVLTSASVSKADSLAKVVSMTFEVTPCAVKVAEGSKSVEVIPNSEITAPITFRFPVDAAVAVGTKADVTHNGVAMTGDFAVAGDDTAKYIEVASATFSTFAYTLKEGGEEPVAVAKVGETTYETFAEAVEAAKAAKAETITLLADCTVDSEVVVGIDETATSMVCIEGTNTVDGGYYTITVKDGGTLKWDYYYTKTVICLNANIVDQTTEGNGLYLRSYGSSWRLTIPGSVTAGGSYKFYGVDFRGGFTAPVVSSSASSCAFYGPVTADELNNSATYYDSVAVKSISKGTFRGPVSAEAISGGSYYRTEDHDSLKAMLVEGKVLLFYGTYLSVSDTSSIAATALRNDKIIYYGTVPNALTYSCPGDVVTMVKKYTSNLTLSNNVSLVISNATGYAKTVLPCDAFHLVKATPQDECVVYANELLTPETAPAYLVRGGETTYCNGVAAALNQAQAGDDVYLNADCAEAVSVKAGVRFCLNGKSMTGTVKAAATDETLAYDSAEGVYVSRLRTAEDPDAVATVDYTSDGQLHYFASLVDAFSKVGSGTTVTLLKDISMTSADCYNSSYIVGYSLSSGETLDGGGHTLTYAGASERYLLYSVLGTVKNLTLCEMCNAIASRVCDGAVFDHVKIAGTLDVTGGNVGAFAIYPYNSSSKNPMTVTFRDCEMGMTIKADGGGSNYNAAFLGNLNMIGSGATFNFERCVVTGNIICGMAAMFYANPCYKTCTVNAVDCYNEGLIHSMYVGSDYVWNPVSAYGCDGSASFTTFNLTVGGVKTTYDGLSKFCTDEVFAKLTRNNGKFLHGPADAALSLQRNDRGGFALTTSAKETAARYVVSQGLFSSLRYDGGSGFFAVEETIETTVSGVTVMPKLMNYRFVDYTWVAANPTAIKGELCGNITYTLGDETFYYIVPGDYYRWVRGEPAAATVYSVSAYDAEGNLLSATVLSDDEYALEIGVGESPEALTYLYDTLEEGFGVVPADGVITLFADNNETFIATAKKEFDLVAGEYVFGTITPAKGYALTEVGAGVWHYGIRVPEVEVKDEVSKPDIAPGVEIPESKQEAVEQKAAEVKEEVKESLVDPAVADFTGTGVAAAATETKIQAEEQIVEVKPAVVEALQKEAEKKEETKDAKDQITKSSKVESRVEITFTALEVKVEIDEEKPEAEQVKATLNSVTYDVKPKVKTTVVTTVGDKTEEQVVETVIPNEVIAGNPITFRLAVNENFGAYVEVRHSDGQTNFEERYLAAVTTDATTGKKYVQLSSDHFSEYTLTSTDSEPVCRVGDKSYASLADAIANGGATAEIVLLANIELTEDVTLGYNQTIDPGEFAISGAGTVTADTDYEVRNVNGKSVVYAKPTEVTVVGDQKIPVCIEPSILSELGGATALATVQANGFQVWQNYVMGVDGAIAGNKLVPICKPNAENPGAAEVTITTPIVFGAAPAKTGIAVTYQLMKSATPKSGFTMVGEGQTEPVFTVDTSAEENATYWKIQAIFTPDAN